jgi:prefoldin subunit 5
MMCLSQEELIKAFEFVEDCETIASMLGTYPTGQDIRDALVETLVCGFTKTNSPVYTMKECLEAYLDTSCLVRLCSPTPKRPETAANTMNYVENVKDVGIMRTRLDTLRSESDALHTEIEAMEEAMEVLRATIESFTTEPETTKLCVICDNPEQDCKTSAPLSPVTPSLEVSSSESETMAKVRGLHAKSEKFTTGLRISKAQATALSAEIEAIEAELQDAARATEGLCNAARSTEGSSQNKVPNATAPVPAEDIRVDTETSYSALANAMIASANDTTSVFGEMWQFFNNKYKKRCALSDNPSKVIHPVITTLTPDLLASLGYKVPNVVRENPGHTCK